MDDLEYGDVVFDEEKGNLKWNLTLGANVYVAKRLSYVVKFSKHKTVNL